MVLQPYEMNVLTRRGIEISSRTCPAQIVKGRRGRDDTTTVSFNNYIFHDKQDTQSWISGE